MDTFALLVRVCAHVQGLIGGAVLNGIEEAGRELGGWGGWGGRGGWGGFPKSCFVSFFAQNGIRGPSWHYACGGGGGLFEDVVNVMGMLGGPFTKKGAPIDSVRPRFPMWTLPNSKSSKESNPLPATRSKMDGPSLVHLEKAVAVARHSPPVGIFFTGWTVSLQSPGVVWGSSGEAVFRFRKGGGGLGHWGYHRFVQRFFPGGPYLAA